MQAVTYSNATIAGIETRQNPLSGTGYYQSGVLSFSHNFLCTLNEFK
jgi:hypothetical protein